MVISKSKMDSIKGIIRKGFNMKKTSWLNRSILWIGDCWIEGIIFIALVATIWSAYSLSINDQGVFAAIVLLAGIPLIIAVAWLLFCVIDVRATLHQIEENTRPKNENYESQLNKPELQHSKPQTVICPYCGEKIPTNTETCPFCGEKLLSRGE